MRMSELADSVLLSRSGLTRLVDRLERAGLLERVKCSEDARLLRPDPPAGREAFNEARRTHLDGVRRLFLSRFSREAARLGNSGARARRRPGLALGHRRRDRVPRPAAHLANRPREPAHALVENRAAPAARRRGP